MHEDIATILAVVSVLSYDQPTPTTPRDDRTNFP
jgi:hypothetical protein